MIMIAEEDLFDACRILFGGKMQVSRSFLEYLQLSGIKSAYRNKARETHPDMLAGKTDAAKKRSADLFQRVQQAYESLNSYLDARERGTVYFTSDDRPFSRKASMATNRSRQTWAGGAGRKSSSRSSTRSSSSSHRWNRQQRPSDNVGRPAPGRQIPHRKLLFGHYLFYSGVINWQTLIKALVWQRTKRPRLGEIGKSFGWLTTHDIINILQARKLAYSFGESAVDMGLLTENQLRLMVFQQNRLQKKFGEYFTQNNILTQGQLDRLIQQFRSHNTAVEAARRAS